MKLFSKIFVVIATGAIAQSASGAIIIDEDFQETLYTNDTSLLSSNSLFTDWYVTTNTSNRVNTARSDGGGDVFLPQGAEAGVNQGIQFEYENAWLNSDTGYTWNSADEYSVSLNATEMSWGNANNRYVGIRIRETGGSVIYTGVVQAMPEYDTNHDRTGDPWAANQLFTWNFTAADFTGGTEGSALTFEVAGIPGAGGLRGIFVDNISFTTVPEPSSMVMFGIAGLAMLLRRRK